MKINTNGKNAEAILEEAGYEKMPGDNGFVKYLGRGIRLHAILLSDFFITLHIDIRKPSKIGEPKHSSIQDNRLIKKEAILILKHC